MESMDVPNARADPASARDISRRCSFAPHFAGGHLLLWDISPGDSAGSQTRWLARKHTGSLANTLARWPTDWRGNRERRAFVDRRAFVRFDSTRSRLGPCISSRHLF